MGNNGPTIPIIEFEDIPLDEARHMERESRMEPMLYHTFRHKIRSLSSKAVRIHLGPEISPQRLKTYILHIARELNVPVTGARSRGPEAWAWPFLLRLCRTNVSFKLL